MIFEMLDKKFISAFAPMINERNMELCFNVSGSNAGGDLPVALFGGHPVA
jgi:hypothetical protein